MSLHLDNETYFVGGHQAGVFLPSSAVRHFQVFEVGRLAFISQHVCVRGRRFAHSAHYKMRPRSVSEESVENTLYHALVTSVRASLTVMEEAEVKKEIDDWQGVKAEKTQKTPFQEASANKFSPLLEPDEFPSLPGSRTIRGVQSWPVTAKRWCDISDEDE